MEAAFESKDYMTEARVPPAPAVVGKTVADAA